MNLEKTVILKPLSRNYITIKVKKNLTLVEKMEVLLYLDGVKESVRNSFEDPSNKPSTMSGFGKYIRKIRFLTKTTMSEMAHFMGISTPEVSGLECRRHVITAEHITGIILFFQSHGVFLDKDHLRGLASDANEAGLSDAIEKMRGEK